MNIWQLFVFNSYLRTRNFFKTKINCYQIQTRTALWLWLRFRIASWSNISVQDPFSWINNVILDTPFIFLSNTEMWMKPLAIDPIPFGVWVKKLQVWFDTQTFSHISYVSPFWNVRGFPYLSFEFFPCFTYHMRCVNDTTCQWYKKLCIIKSILNGPYYDPYNYSETYLDRNIFVMFIWFQVCWWFHLFDVI